METEKIVSLVLNGIAVISIPIYFLILIMAGGGPDIPDWYGKRAMHLTFVHIFLVLVSVGVAWKLRGLGEHRLAWAISLLPLASIVIAGYMLFKADQASDIIREARYEAHRQAPTTFTHPDGYEISKSIWIGNKPEENIYSVSARDNSGRSIRLGQLVGESELVLEIENEYSIFPPIKNAAQAKEFFKSFRNQRNQGFWDVFRLSDRSKYDSGI